MASLFAFVEGIGGMELLMVMFIVLLLFGANKLPDLARGLGRATREFKKATSGVEEEIRHAMEEKPEPSEEAKRFAPKPVVVPPQNTLPASAVESAPATPTPPAALDPGADLRPKPPTSPSGT
jgi:sec-independent protein translocase protein TatA